MTAHKIKLAPDFSDGVDRKLLNQIRDRFLKVNQGRLDNAFEVLSLRHQDILRVLPLLYQVNHALLPGYVAQDTPYGLSGFEPDKEVLSIAKSFSQSFKFRQDRRHAADIHSIFMMGSTGTLAHSEASDVDLWLCVSPELSEFGRQALQEKAEKIDAWANDLGLELHTFLMDAEQFRSGDVNANVDAENSGSTQHFLLLDEFYRTAILLAGRYPLWWIIPPEYEDRYEETTKMLLIRRFVKAAEVLDFGSAAHIPKNELIGAGLWQLYKALDAPYKSVLKLLLAEAYAQELPNLPTLSQQFKQAVYDDELDLDQLDPYVQIYKRLEAYLTEKHEMKRLDLVRKSFYLKVGKKLSKQSSSKKTSWQVQTLEKLVKSWAWPDVTFRYLDDRIHWKFDQVWQERQEIVAELSNAYRFLSNFSRANNLRSSMTAEDLNMLGRKLYAVFQRKAGKVERVNPGIAPNLWEENLAIHHASSQPFVGDEQSWFLYRDLSSPGDAAFHPVLKKSASLMDLLSWLYVNGILNRETRLSLVPGNRTVTMYELQQLIQGLEQAIPYPLPSLPQQNFLRTSEVSKLALFINVGVDPFASYSEQGVSQISDRTDPLSFSKKRLNLVQTIDQVALNSWNELSAHRYVMGETLLQNLQAYLQICYDQQEGSDFELFIHCYGQQRGELIAKRVRRLFKRCKAAYFSNGGRFTPVRYVLEVGSEYYVFMHVDGQFRFLAAHSEVQLFQLLEQSVKTYSPIVLDDGALVERNLLKQTLKHAHPQMIQFFYCTRKDKIDLIVRDENGSLFQAEVMYEEEKPFLSGIKLFMRSYLDKRELSASIEGGFSHLDFSFYRLTEKQPGQYHVARIENVPDIDTYEVQVSVLDQSLEPSFDISLGHTTYPHSEHGDRQIDALCHRLRAQPTYDRSRPIKLADISYPMDAAGLNVQQGANTLKTLKLYFEVQGRINLS